MKKLLIIITLFTTPAYACGIPPIPPVGCFGGQAQCVCTPDGNCHWIYICQ